MGRTVGVELGNIFQMDSLVANKRRFRLTETIHRLRLNSANVFCDNKGDFFFLDKAEKLQKLHFTVSTFKSLKRVPCLRI